MKRKQPWMQVVKQKRQVPTNKKQQQRKMNRWKIQGVVFMKIQKKKEHNTCNASCKEAIRLLTKSLSIFPNIFLPGRVGKPPGKLDKLFHNFTNSLYRRLTSGYFLPAIEACNT